MLRSPLQKILDEAEEQIAVLMAQHLNRVLLEKRLSKIETQTIINVFEFYENIRLKSHPSENVLNYLIKTLANTTVVDKDNPEKVKEYGHFDFEKFEQSNYYKDFVKAIEENLTMTLEQKINLCCYFSKFEISNDTINELKNEYLKTNKVFNNDKFVLMLKDKNLAIKPNLMINDVNKFVKESILPNITNEFDKKIYDAKIDKICTKEFIVKCKQGGAATLIHQELIKDINEQTKVDIAKMVTKLSQDKAGRPSSITDLAPQQTEEASSIALEIQSHKEEKSSINEMVQRLNQMTRGALARMKFEKAIGGNVYNNKEMLKPEGQPNTLQEKAELYQTQQTAKREEYKEIIKNKNTEEVLNVLKDSQEKLNKGQLLPKDLQFLKEVENVNVNRIVNSINELSNNIVKEQEKQETYLQQNPNSEHDQEYKDHINALKDVKAELERILNTTEIYQTVEVKPTEPQEETKEPVVEEKSKDPVQEAIEYEENFKKNLRAEYTPIANSEYKEAFKQINDDLGLSRPELSEEEKNQLREQRDELAKTKLEEIKNYYYNVVDKETEMYHEVNADNVIYFDQRDEAIFEQVKAFYDSQPQSKIDKILENINSLPKGLNPEGKLDILRNNGIKHSNEMEPEERKAAFEKEEVITPTYNGEKL